MKKDSQVLGLEKASEVLPPLLALRVLGDALVCIGNARPKATLLEGTMENLGHRSSTR
jgi:hypothetical protein